METNLANRPGSRWPKPGLVWAAKCLGAALGPHSGRVSLVMIWKMHPTMVMVQWNLARAAAVYFWEDVNFDLLETTSWT